MSAPPQIFDRQLVRRHRGRAIRLGIGHILGKIVAEEILERLSIMQRRFSSALVLGPIPRLADDLRKQVPFCVHADLALKPKPGGPTVVADEELLPFAETSFDLVASALSLHWLNDLPGALIQINRSLKPDGLFLGALLGGDTLMELRAAFSSSEIELTGGLSPRLSPAIDIRDAGGLLQRAGFALPVADIDRLTLSFDTPFALLSALRESGETNALSERPRKALRKDILARMTGTYAAQFGDGSGAVRATFEIVYLAGWAPHESQQKPLTPGSARMRLSEALKTHEKSGGKSQATDRPRNPPTPR